MGSPTRQAAMLAAAWLIGGAVTGAQAPRVNRQLAQPASIADLRQWDARIDSMLRAGDLQVRRVVDDPQLPGRQHERVDQYYRGVKVFGADIVRQVDRGQTVSVFGLLYADLDLDTRPRLGTDEARTAIERVSGRRLGPSRTPELMILPGPGGGYVLTYRARVATVSDVRVYFLDANTGEISYEYSDRRTQSAVGRGTGVLGDAKKISVRPLGGQFLAQDQLRPPDILSYDMRGDVERTVDFLNGVVRLGTNDLASDTDNTWTDAANVDAHVYAGWVHDYFYKRFNRRGLDNRDLPITSVTHPVRRQDLLANYDRYGDDVLDFYLNAFYCCDGIMVYGEGLPPGYVAGTGQTVDYFSGALDIVAHELAHGVTDFTSQLIYEGESGALNEAFSDIMATSVEFFFQAAGSGLLRADYLLGEDTIRPGGVRSMSNPSAYGDPDHYSARYTGQEDNGGVHINSAIANQAFFLAVEGGTNRTSGQSVQGVGAATREQIEQVFYRAFTLMLPAGASFSLARAACEQAARDLYGTGSAALRAVQQAWAAVGVS